VTVTPGTLDAAGTSLPFHAVLALPGHDYAYDGAVPLRETSKGWRVAFTSATVHPKLRNGQTLKVVSEPAEARFVDRAGRELTRDEDLVQNLLGVDAERGLRRLGVAAAGSGPSTLAVVDAGTGATLTELATWPGSTKGGTRTTLDLTVQAAAEKALASTRGRAGLVALDVSTGEVRALANSPVSGDPASLEPNAPGSTFKIITAAAALEQGLTPTSSVDCPGSVVIGGRTIRNHEEARPGSVTLTTAFAQSCNTAFAALGARLPQGALERTAARFGFGVDQLLPIASPGGSLPAPDSTARLVEDSIGQGQVTASPLAMASVAAGVAAGTWHQPHVLPCPRCASHDVPHAADLRTLMRAVVTSGTGTKADLPGRPVYGKTGTAEYGTGAQLPTHAWFVGWRGGIAFAVYVEDGVSGGSVAAPVAARFLRSLPAGL
jgi:cell division protein FtsI/penicillin-binding protein 2